MGNPRKKNGKFFPICASIVIVLFLTFVEVACLQKMTQDPLVLKALLIFFFGSLDCLVGAVIYKVFSE